MATAENPSATTIEFRVYGDPLPVGAIKIAPPRGNMKFPRKYRSRSDEPWREMVAIAAREHLPQCPIEGPIRLTVRFWLARPKIHYRSGANARKLRPSAPRYPISAKRSDLDNLLKPMMDVLTRLRMWHDDAQVCQHGEGHGKYYVATDVRPGATVTIEEI